MTDQAVRRALKLRRPGRHLAAIIKGSRILEYAYSDTTKTKAVCDSFGYPYGYPHAEFAVILKFIRTKPKWKLQRCTMLVMRWTRNGSFAVASPCLTCRKMIAWAGIRNTEAVQPVAGVPALWQLVAV